MKVLKLISVTLLLSFQIPAHADIVGDYIFAENLSGNIADAPDMVYLGPVLNYETGSIEGFDVDAIGIEFDTGLQLDLSQWSLCDEYSVVIHGVLDDVTGYKKIIDFRELNGDPGLYNNGGVIEYYIGQPAANTAITAGEYFWVVWTRDASAQVRIYLNGDLQVSFEDTSLTTNLCSINDLYFFKDEGIGALENPSGAVARISVYDHALTEDEVGELEILDIIFANDFSVLKVP